MQHENLPPVHVTFQFWNHFILVIILGIIDEGGIKQNTPLVTLILPIEKIEKAHLMNLT